MPLAEGLIIRLVPEKRRKPGHLEGYPDTLFQPRNERFQSHGLGIPAFQGGTHGSEEMGILRVHYLVRGQLQRPDKGLFQLRQEVQRSAQKGHTAPDGLAAGQAGNGLVHHGLENRGRQVCLGGTLVDQGLDVRLGEYAAAGGDWVDLLVVFRLFVQLPGIDLQQRRHLVDEGAGSAGADTVHPLLQAAGEVNDLGILASQLNGHIRLGIEGLQGRGHRHHLLDKANVQGLGQGDGTGARDLDRQAAVSQLLPGILQ